MKSGLKDSANEVQPDPRHEVPFPVATIAAMKSDQAERPRVDRISNRQLNNQGVATVQPTATIHAAMKSGLKFLSQLIAFGEKGTESTLTKINVTYIQ